MPFLTGRPAVALVLLILLVAVALLVVGRLPGLLPKGSRLERWFLRWVLMLQVLIGVVGALGAVHIVYQNDGWTWRLLTLGVFAAAFWAVRDSLTDIAGGLSLRAEGALTPGEEIGTGNERGRVLRVGLRSVEIETDDGRLVRIPYTTLSRSSIETTSEEGAIRSLTFAVDLEKGADPMVMIETLRQRALLSPWSSALRPPTARVVENDDGGKRIEMTVFPVDFDQAGKIEAAVREGL